MKKLSLLLCTALIIIMTTGCILVNFGHPLAGGPGISGRGTSERFTFSTGEITEINVALFCNIELYATPSDTVTLDVQPNLMEYIVVEESGGVLTVRSTRAISLSDNNAPVLTIGTPALSRVTFSGAGTFTAHDTIAADSFSLEMGGAGTATADLEVRSLSIIMSGAGDIRLSGTADTAVFRLSGAGRVEALALQTSESDVSLAGVGTVSVACSERLNITASGVGTVEYRGSPSVDVTRGGLVTVRQVS